MRLLAMLLALLLTIPAAAQTPEERTRLDWAVARGRLLFEIDRAAWVGTDDMIAHIPDAASSGIRGYIVERDNDGFAVTFFGGDVAAPVAYYRGRVENRLVVSRQVYPANARPSLTPIQRRMAAVSELSRTIDRRPCGTTPFNTAIIPPETPNSTIDLYLLTPQVSEGEFPFGGHYRYTIDASGNIQSSRAFTNSCISLGSRGARPDERLEALFITHSLDPIPTEIHVFNSLSAHIAVGVRTANPDRVWWVAGDRIEIENGQP